MTTFEADVVVAVLQHMNNDHPDDNLLISRAFGDSAADSAVMTGLDGLGGHWTYQLNGDTHELSVPWSTPISERANIRREVVVLYDAACERLEVKPRSHD